MTGAGFRKLSITALVLVVVLVMPGGPGPSRVMASTSNAFVFQWAGTPAAPQAWRPALLNDWDLVAHHPDYNSDHPWGSAIAGHGADCAAPPATHTVSDPDNSVFICRNHMMTTLDASPGEIQFAPSRMADWSQGTVSINYSMSTTRSSPRDWTTMAVTPFQNNLVLPGFADQGLPGGPVNGLIIQMCVCYPTKFDVSLVVNNQETDLRTGGGSVEDALAAHGLAPSAVTRSRFELDISQTHVRFGMPDFGLWWADRDVPAMPFTQGVVQIGQADYDPEKGCDGCRGNTYHWSDFAISSPVPFTMIHPTGAPQHISIESDRKVFSLPAPSPANSFLRMAGIGDVKFSIDGGASWQTPRVQPSFENPSGAYLGRSQYHNFWTPIPAGVTSVAFTGGGWDGGAWMVEDASVWSDGRSAPGPAVPAIPPAQAPAPAATSSSVAVVPRAAVPAAASPAVKTSPAQRNVVLVLGGLGAGGTVAAVLASLWWRRRRQRSATS